MEPVISSKLITKCQATIPEKIRGVLDLHPGDSVAFEIMVDQKVLIRKAMPIDFEFAGALEGTLASDEEAYRDL